ncbi:ABC transporter permease subunit [Haloarcula sp. 1CSR25-25]|uniref:ABC transporter permease subunit n=1 Tax=Haloarcula sp. 1CSR25-25 TaxID=2862545 RepID=UPI002895EF7F|nr:ABC transporter permease subunit [Haloarcula sp. 1CSR25-25]MDT3437344.1 ABC transporter permease subunit [Haloarcula sp. 1CSR25-25]
MFEVTRYEGRRRMRGTAVLTVLLAVYALLIVFLYPSIAESSVDFEEYVESLPPAFQEGFVGSANFSTVEGFLSIEMYQFLWLLLLGLYVAYSGGALVAGDVETGQLDMLLATPISRSRVVVEKYLSLLVPVLGVNLVTPFVVYVGLLAIDETIDPVSLFALHLLSIPYLLMCAGVGLLLSVRLDRADIAQRGGIGAVFGLFLLDTVSTDTDFEWLGALSPTRYFSPVDILSEGTYDVAGALLLLAGAIACVGVSVVLFQRRDI